MSLRWTISEHDAQLVREIEGHSNVSPVIAQILALRGITKKEQVSSFLEMKMTDLRAPEDLPGVLKAVDVIYPAIVEKKKICVYGDYDCDGMTSTSILYLCLQLLGADVTYFIPSRLDDGYGLNIEALERLKKNQAVQLVVSVDCGINSVKEVEFAKENGMQIVITDHHHPGPELPDADAVVHPALPGHNYPFADLCGAGVAFKLAWALCVRYHGSPKLSEPLRNYLFRSMSLAAIGTVADVVPLLDENRIIVHHGLKCLNMFSNPGLASLLKLAKLDTKEKLASEDVGFGIGPRLNAAGRLSQGQLGVELLTTESADKGLELANYLDKLNQDRKKLERKIFREASKMIEENCDPENEPAIVLASPDWHMGVIGITAGRIAEAHQRPTVLISLDPLGNRSGVGSCRSACGINLYDALNGASEHLETFGGHAAAAGVGVASENVHAFREDFFAQVIEQCKQRWPTNSWIDCMEQDLDIDAEVLLGNLTLSTMKELEKIAPFGQNNSIPIFCATEVQLATPAAPMGDGSHLQVQLVQHNSRIRAVAFGKGEWIEQLNKTPGESFDFAFKPVVNDFRGRYSVELHLIDFRPANSSVPAPKMLDASKTPVN